MKNYLLPACMLVFLFFSCKKEISNDTDQLVSNGKAPAPPPATILQWQQCIGTSLDDFGNSVAEASDGYFIVGHIYDGSIVNVATATKIGTNGGVVWSDTVKRSSSVQFSSVVATSDGGCLAAGYDINGIVLVKYSSAGVREWINTVGANGNEVGYEMIRTSDGSFALVGRTMSNGDQYASMWFVKFSIASGAPVVELEKKLPGVPGSHGENAYGVAEGPNGSFVIVGTSYIPSSPDFFIQVIDNSGNVINTKRLGTAQGSDIGWDATSCRDANNVITGTVITGVVGNNIYVQKMGPVGEEVWSRSFVTGSARSVVASVDGIIVTGFTSNRSGDVIATKGGQDLFVLRLNDAGSKLSNYAFGGNKTEIGRKIISTSDGGYLVVGETTSNNNGDVFGNHGLQDAWAIKIKY